MSGQVHAFPQTSVDERICSGHQTEVLAERRRLGVEEHDGLVRDRGGELGVDSGNEVMNVFLSLVGFRRSESDLNQYHLSAHNGQSAELPPD